MSKGTIAGIQLVYTQLWNLVTSLWKALASAWDDGSEVAIDQQSQKSRRKAGCDVGESEVKVELPKTNGTPICLLPLPTLTVGQTWASVLYKTQSS